MRKALAAAGLVALLWTAGVAGQQPSVYTPAGALPVLDNYLESLRQQTDVPGMSAAVVREGVVIWEKGYGFQNVASRIRATPDTPYLVGDISGTLAAAVLLECVEQRRLELDQPIQRYGIDIAQADSTVRELLSHTSVDNPQEPFVYSLERYAQLTPVVEWCKSAPYRQAITTGILDRLAMRDSVPGTDLRTLEHVEADSGMDDDDLDRYKRILDRMALPYKIDNKSRPERIDLPGIPITAAGGLVSTVRDLAKFDGALDSGQILLEETLAAAWNPAVSRRGAAVPMGLGWFVQSHRGERIVWHFGLVANAYSSLILKLPDRKLTLILLANSDRLNAPFQLESGDVTRSLFASLFLRLVT